MNDPQSAPPDNTSPQPQAATQAATQTPDPSQAASQPVSANTSQTQPQPQGTLPPPNPTTTNTPSQPAGPTAQSIAPAQATSNPQSSSNTVSNAPTPQTHPAILRAGILHSIGATLAGGERYKTTIDPVTGETTRTPVPLSRGEIGMAIALEAISGALTGLSQSGPGAGARGAALAFQQGQQAQQQRQQFQEQQAQTDAANKSQALLRQASLAHTNAETVASVSEAEQRGQDAILKLADINRQSGILDVDPVLLDNNGQPMTQADLMAAMQSGKLSATDSLGPVAGAQEVTAKDGSKHWESTHLVIKDPESKVDLTPEMYAKYHDAGVPGFQGLPPGTTVQIPLRMLQQFNETAASHYLASERLNDLKATLQGTPESNQVPTSIDWNKPGVNAAMSRFRYYVSHNSDNLNDPFLALQAMGADKRDPKTGAMQQNPDAKYVDTVAQTFGGWPLLEAAHNQILAQRKQAESFAVVDSVDKANAILASPRRFSADQLSSAQNFIRLANQQGAAKASQEARARAVAEGTDVQAMYRFGRNPITGEQLSLQNAPDAMLVDSQGRVIPQDLTATYKPTAQERQTADTARQVLSISNDLQQAINKNPAIIGPLAGRSKQLLAKAGVGDAEAQTLLDNVSFLQTASTKMHTGRFSNQILDKMGELIKPGMNPDQFKGALSSINAVAQRYANEDKLVTVADLKAMQDGNQQQLNALQAQQPNAHIVPPGAIPGRNAKGEVIGYKTTDGKVVKW